LIGSLSQSTLADRKGHVQKVLRLLQSNAAAENDDQRPGTNRRGAKWEIQSSELLDADLTDINKNCRWGYADLCYQKQLMDF
jgi:hypothetical protein